MCKCEHDSCAEIIGVSSYAGQKALTHFPGFSFGWSFYYYQNPGMSTSPPSNLVELSSILFMCTPLAFFALTTCRFCPFCSIRAYIYRTQCVATFCGINSFKLLSRMLKRTNLKYNPGPTRSLAYFVQPGREISELFVGRKKSITKKKSLFALIISNRSIFGAPQHCKGGYRNTKEKKKRMNTNHYFIFSHRYYWTFCSGSD